MNDCELVDLSCTLPAIMAVEAVPVVKHTKMRMYASAAGNFCIQYNLSCLAIAVVLGSTPTNSSDVLEVPPWADKVLYTTIFAGCIIGMVGMGIMGDVIGRERGLAITAAMIATGTLISAWCTWPGYYMWEVLCLCRGVVGLGIGGVYPLSAASAAECDDHKHKQEKTSTAVAWSFFWQSPGLMAPYLVSLVLLMLKVNHILAFRCVLSFGALPALFVLAVSLSDQRKVRAFARKGNVQLREQVLQKKYWLLLFGTGGTWLLFDVAYYGVSVFTPYILKTIFERHQRVHPLTPWQLSVRTVWSASFATVGTLCAVAFLRRWDAKTLNTVGFILMAICFSFLSASLSFDGHWWSNSDVEFFMFSLLLFSVNCGPNTATYVLPTQVFPKNVRSTFHGFSSGLGKFGAAMGTFLYPELRSYHIPLGTIMAAQACVCILGAFVSHMFIPGVSTYSSVSTLDICDDESTITTFSPRASAKHVRSRPHHDVDDV